MLQISWISSSFFIMRHCCSGDRCGQWTSCFNFTTICTSGFVFFTNLCVFKFLFVCLFGFLVPLDNFSLIWRRHYHSWRASNFGTHVHWRVRVLICGTKFSLHIVFKHLFMEDDCSCPKQIYLVECKLFQQE